ncbi:MAG: hypothetical protein HZB79_01980 [Deltaproteobacteria bacterium]|nr:hypothetical protein [Deltaproteobacteria bacterium]
MTNQTEIKQKIWTTLDKLRGHFPIGDSKLLELIAATKGTEKLDSILGDVKTIQLLTSRYDGFVPPLYIFNFINDLSKSVNPKSHLDPWLTPSSPCIFFDFGTTTAYCLNQTASEIIKTVFANAKTEIHLGDGSKQLDGVKTKFDFITSFPPFGMRKEPIEINGFKTSNDFASTLLIQSSMLLNDNGKAVFLMSPSFLIDKKNKEVINKLGLFVDAVFAIPNGAFLPQSNIASNLVVITKQQKEKTFIAEISSDEKANKAVLDNYKNHRAGKVIQLGALVDIKEFKSLQALVSENEMQELVKRIGYSPIHLTEFASAINAMKQDNKDEVEHISNSIYLPKVGNSPVVTNPSEMKIKPKNYFQIQLDETKANSIYVANYFNSAIGKKLREGLEVGAVILQISKSQLSNCILHLPDIKTQLELIEIDSKIDQFSFRLDELKRNLWKQPRSYNSISKELKSINQEEKLEHWIDTLPFPISSILWRYYATKENYKKVEHLFHFFEALSEFFSMIMLSALVQDKEFYKQECHKWIDTDERFKEWYFRATFGSWNILTSRLSKATREYLADKDKQELCKSIYGNPSVAFLTMLTCKGIVNILLSIADLRNKWKGHGGITSEEENKQRVTTLEQQLNELRKFIADGFEETRMLSPTTSSYEDGVFTFNAKKLVGARTPFNEISIQSLIPLDKKKLYLAHSSQNKPVELLPFIKFVEVSDAVYFYTSIESKNVRWVSYHFDKNPEINQPADNELFKAFEFLKGNDSKI